MTSDSVRNDPALAAAVAASTTIPALLDRNAERFGNRVAMDLPSIESDRLRLSFLDIRDRARALAAGLVRSGVRKGDRIGIVADGAAYAECVLAYLALLHIGAVMVPVNPRYVDDEIRQALEMTGCVGIFAAERFAQRLDRMDLPLHTRVGIGSWSADGWIAWVDLAAIGEALDEPDLNSDDIANIIFTSGTTGKPKGVIHTHATALACGAIYATGLTLDSDDVYHHGIPFVTSSGMQFTLMAALWSGATLVVEATFDAPAILRRMESAGTTVFLGVPSHLLFLIDALPSAGDVKLPALRMWNYGGSVMPQEAIDRLKRFFPNVAQRQNYGMTETGPTGAILDPDAMAAHPGSTGRPMPLCEIRITDESGASVKAGEVGEIRVRSPACMIGYYGNAEATRETLIDGWVRTGDIGRLDDEGFLYYIDRLKDIVVRGGLKISSVEIEEAIYRLPGVLEAAVVAVPHARLGEDIAACVVPRHGSTVRPDEIQAMLRQTLADFKIPRNIHVMQALPKNAMGKILKSELRKSLLAMPTTT